MLAVLTRNYATSHNISETDMDTLEKVVVEKVEAVLLSDEFKEKRARNLDIDDFIKLLLKFNKEGIHFT